MRWLVVSGTGSAGSLHHFFAASIHARPVRGTLNLQPVGEARLPVEGIDMRPKLHLAPGHWRHACPTLWPATLQGVRCWAFTWFGDLRHGQVEVIAEVHLRTALGLEDGDEVELIFEEGSHAQV